MEKKLEHGRTRKQKYLFVPGLALIIMIKILVQATNYVYFEHPVDNFIELFIVLALQDLLDI